MPIKKKETKKRKKQIKPKSKFNLTLEQQKFVALDNIDKRLEFYRHEHHKHVGYNLKHFMYWSSLFLVGLSNLIGSFFILPVLLFFEGISLTLIIGLIGLVFGLLFTFLIIGLENMEGKHNIILGLLMPILATLDVLILMTMTRILSINYNINHENELVSNTIAFIFMFLLPYMVHYIINRFTRINKNTKTNIKKI